MIGRPVRRKEDFRLLTGRGRFTDDARASGQAHAAFLRSPHAHARIAADQRQRLRLDLGQALQFARREHAGIDVGHDRRQVA